MAAHLARTVVVAGCSSLDVLLAALLASVFAVRRLLIPSCFARLGDV